MPKFNFDLKYDFLQLTVVAAIAFAMIYAAFPPDQVPIKAVKTAVAFRQNPITVTPPVQKASSSPAPAKPVPAAATTSKTFSLQARTAIIYDLDTEEIIYQLRANEKRPIASISKIMTIYAASLLMPAETEIVIDQSDAALQSSAGLIAGEHWRFSDLSAFTLVSSSNGGAQAIGRAAGIYSSKEFVGLMNDVALEVGLSDTYFRNETGLDLYEGQVSGSYSTAKDIAKLFGHILNTNPGLLSATTKRSLTVYSLDDRPHQAINTNLLLAQIPSIIAGKTGTTDLAGGNLALVVSTPAGKRYAIVVLGSTPQGRFSDAQKLYDLAKKTGKSTRDPR